MESLEHRPDMQHAIRRLMTPDHMLATICELAVREPDLMRLVLQASVAALEALTKPGLAPAELQKNQW